MYRISVQLEWTEQQPKKKRKKFGDSEKKTKLEQYGELQKYNHICYIYTYLKKHHIIFNINWIVAFHGKCISPRHINMLYTILIMIIMKSQKNFVGPKKKKKKVYYLFDKNNEFLVLCSQDKIFLGHFI